MPGASEKASQVKVQNANWVAGPDGTDGKFEVMIVTADGQQHTISPSPAAMTALLALAKTGRDHAVGPNQPDGNRRQPHRHLAHTHRPGQSRGCARTSLN